MWHGTVRLCMAGGARLGHVRIARLGWARLGKSWQACHDGFGSATCFWPSMAVSGGGVAGNVWFGKGAAPQLFGMARHGSAGLAVLGD